MATRAPAGESVGGAPSNEKGKSNFSSGYSDEWSCGRALASSPIGPSIKFKMSEQGPLLFPTTREGQRGFYSVIRRSAHFYRLDPEKKAGQNFKNRLYTFSISQDEANDKNPPIKIFYADPLKGEGAIINTDIAPTDPRPFPVLNGDDADDHLAQATLIENFKEAIASVSVNIERESPPLFPNLRSEQRAKVQKNLAAITCPCGRLADLKPAIDAMLASASVKVFGAPSICTEK